MNSTSSRRAFLQQASLLGAASAATPLLAQTASSRAAAPSGASSRVDAKVTDLRAYVVDRAILVEVVSDAGVSGWGECAFDGANLMKVFVDDRLKREIVGGIL